MFRKVATRFQFACLFHIALLLPIGPAIAQPFGIAMGTPLSELHVIKQVSPFYYLVSPRISHPDFEGYTVQATQSTGVCTVTAYSETLSNDSEGYRVRTVFDRITQQLTGKYGRSKLFNFLHANSIWSEPNEWAVSIAKNERSYVRFWDKEEDSTLLNGLLSIALRAKALDEQSTYVDVHFEFENLEKCHEVENSSGAGAL